mgnify:CR=1 FL=1
MALITVSNNSLTAITAVPASVPTGALTLIKSITASSSASISFVNGASGVVLDDTYKSYVFKFISMHNANDAADFQFQVDTGANTNYNQTITSMGFLAEHSEDNSANTLAAAGGSAILHQETVFQDLGRSLGNDNDQSLSGELHLFNPSSTTFVKHFIGVINEAGTDNQSVQRVIAGYINTTTAITTIQFKMDSGNIDSGIIKLYGVK